METQKVIVPVGNPQQITAPMIVQKSLPVVRQPSPKSKGKKVPGTRVSNRRYPARKCQKADCDTTFIPTDSRQIYCSKQHQIDQNNDRRKVIDKMEREFAQQVKKNKEILVKIFNSNEYKSKGLIHISVLNYEGYDFNFYHSTMIEYSTKRELKICYDYAILLADSENQYYKIINKQSHGI
jgi:hypothetical protein